MSANLANDSNTSRPAAGETSDIHGTSLPKDPAGKHELLAVKGLTRRYMLRHVWAGCCAERAHIKELSYQRLFNAQGGVAVRL